MTVQADPSVFQRPATPTQVAVKTTTRKNADGSTDVVDQNGNVVSHTPAPPVTAPTTTAPQNLGSLTPTAPQPAAPTAPKPFNPNDPSTYTTRTNADGSIDYIDLSGNIAQHGNPPTGSPGSNGGGTGGASAGQPLFGYNTPGLDLSGQTPPQQTIAPQDQAAAGADAKAMLDEIVQWKLNHFGASPDDLRAAEASIRAAHPLGSAALATSSSGGAFSDPTFAASQSNQSLINRTVAQTTGDIARVSSGGATGVSQDMSAAGQATNTGTQVYSDANALAAAARNLGVTGLSTAEAQGRTAQATAGSVANPMYQIASEGIANGANSRAQAQDLAARTGMSLDEAQASVNKLLGVNTTAGATAQLDNFQGNAGTAGTLNSMPMGAEATNRLGSVVPSTGDANQLEGLSTGVSATGALGSFGGNAGTAGALQNTDTNLASTRLASGFTAAPGEATTLARTLNTNAAATGQLGQFTGNAGTAPALSSFDTSTAATGQLGAFGAGGNADLAKLESFANGGDIGPSAAEALLRKNENDTMSQNIALARSGRGAGSTAANMRQAIFQNAATGQQAGNDMAALRAQEAATARGQNIQASTAAAGTATTQSGQQLSALQTKQSAETTALQTKLQALVASGQMTQEQASQQLDALKSKQQGELASIAQKSTNVATAGQQEQTASAQQLDAIKTQQAGETASLTARLNALVAAGQMTQAQANMQLTALQSQQQGELASIAQQSTNLATAGQQRQVASAQSLDALKAQQQGELQAESDRIQALVAAGQMTQTQAAQQLDALKSAQTGQLTSSGQEIQKASTAAQTQVNIGQVQGDLTKAFATLGLQYDVNSGQVYNQAGQLVQGGDKIAADLLSSGLQNQVGQGQVAASVTNQGMQTLQNLTNTSVDAQKAAATLGFQTSAAIASLSQGELSELQGIVANQNAEALQKWATDKGFQLQVDQNNAQATGAIFSALGTIVAGAAILSDGRAKTSKKPMSLREGLLSPVGAKYDIAPLDAGTVFGGAPARAGVIGDGYNFGFNQQPNDDFGTKTSPGLSSAQMMAILQMGGAAGGAFGRAIASDDKGKKKRKAETFEEWIDMMPAKMGKGDGDMRAAKGYSYLYKDPNMPGAMPGRQYGPMAEDLKKTSAKDAVFMGPDKLLRVDPERVVMPLLAGVGEQQRRLDELEATVKRLANGH